VKRLSLVSLALALLACGACTHYGRETVLQGEVTSSALFFVHAPPGAEVWIDGVNRGVAEAFDGKKDHFAFVSPGRHTVAVTVSGQKIYDRPVYVESAGRMRIDLRESQ
jgi:hypothetical protein